MKSLLLMTAFLASSIALACPSDKLCVGDRIIDDGDRAGTVLEIFDNGKVSVTLDGGAYDSYVKEASSLGKAVRCLENICVKNRIMEESDRTGSVLEVFDNGKAIVKLDGGAFNPYVRRVETLAKKVRCSQTICNKDRIMDDGDRVGSVVEVFSNGKAIVTFDGGAFKSYVRKTEDLGKGYRCIENLCVGDRIIDESDKVGKVLELFDNGKAKVSLEGGAFPSYVRTFSQLGVKLNCRLRENCSCRN